MPKELTQVANSQITKLTPLQAIRAWCIDCSGNSSKEANRCSHSDCPLHYFRLGKNPNRKGIGGAHTKGKRYNAE